MNVHTLRRLGVFAGIMGAGYALMTTVSPLTDALGAEDGVVFLLASLIFVICFKTSAKLFTEHPLNYALFFSMGASFISLGFMLSSAWAISWRALNYSPLAGDNFLRFTFRWFYVWGCVCFLVGSELFDRTPDEIGKRMRRLGVVLACIALTVVVLVSGWRLEQKSHYDRAPPVLEDAH